MSEKQSEAFDEWFKDASDGYEPAFNEEAWEKMEAKLDSQAKRRKRPLAWWWWLADALMVGVVLYMAFDTGVRNGKKNDAADTVSNILPQKAKPESKANGVYDDSEIQSTKAAIKETQETLPVTGTETEPSISGEQKINGTSAQEKTSSVAEKNIADGDKNNNSQQKKYGAKLVASTPSNNKKIVEESKAIGQDKAGKENQAFFAQKNGRSGRKVQLKTGSIVKNRVGKKDASIDIESGESETSTSDEKLLQSKLNKKDIVAPSSMDSGVSSTKSIASSSIKNDSATTSFAAKTKDSLDDIAALKKEQQKKNKNKAVSNKGKFFIYGAASPEWSFIFGNKTGKATMAYGAGMGYNFGKRWSVSAGFNITKKIYTAGAGDYKIVKGSYWDNPNISITHIDANCSVYEIPIAVRYSVLQRKNYSLYASMGIATTIMKREVYDYDYTRNGWANYYNHTYKTGKSQFLSGAIISVGYARKLSNSFSVMAEPYFKMPLQGVGEGEVKIGSVGLSIGVQYTLPGFK